jgi:nitroimidazol reductase NimA-like FMN-containing flavoprotein (pyridoxamine 5'-phosphate oxidase superfamily)
MENIKAILADNLIGTVATLNEDGSPWATPVHVFSDDTAVYWFSKETHQHSVNVQRDPRVSVALWSNTQRTKGAYISGTATKLDAEKTQRALDIVVATVGGIPPVFENTSAYQVEIGESNTSKSSENRWYFYT